MDKAWAWLKPKLLWIAIGAGAVLGAVAAVLTFGRSRQIRGSVIPRPVLKDPEDVSIPDVNLNINMDFESNPFDKFEEEKAQPASNKDKVIADINSEFS